MTQANKNKLTRTAPPTRAVIYARFSPRRGAEQCASIQTQLQYCHQWCAMHQLEVIGEQFDEAISGANAANRPGFQSAVDLACSEKAVLVVYSLSRFARCTKDAIAYVDKLNQAGANIASLHEQIDTTTAMGRFFFTIIAAMASMEREQISERTSGAMIAQQASGKRMSAVPPYGWRRDPYDDSKIVEDLREQENIGLMIAQWKQGIKSTYKIAQKLETMGVAPRKAKWYSQTVNRILRREVDAGRFDPNA